MATKAQTHTLTKPTFVKLADVKPGIHGYNTFVKIEEIKKEQIKRYDGTQLTIAEGLAGDDTGIIRFRVIGEYANILEKGKSYAWRNGLSEVFQERHRLSLDQFGRITAERDDLVTVNQNGKKYSDIEYVRKVQPRTERPNTGRRENNRDNREHRDNRDNRDNRENRENRGDRGDRDNTNRRPRGGNRDNNREGGNRDNRDNREGGNRQNRDNNRDNRGGNRDRPPRENKQ